MIVTDFVGKLLQYFL